MGFKFVRSFPRVSDAALLHNSGSLHTEVNGEGVLDGGGLSPESSSARTRYKIRDPPLSFACPREVASQRPGGGSKRVDNSQPIRLRSLWCNRSVSHLPALQCPRELRYPRPLSSFESKAKFEKHKKINKILK